MISIIKWSTIEILEKEINSFIGDRKIVYLWEIWVSYYEGIPNFYFIIMEVKN